MYRYILPFVAIMASTAAFSAGNERQRQEAQDKADLSKALAGFTAGPAKTCIQSRLVRDEQRFGDTILYKFSPNEIYLNNTGGGCYGLRDGDAIITQSLDGNFCRGDIVRTVNLSEHMASGSCTFGDFIPYKK